MSEPPLLQIEDLDIHYHLRDDDIRAVSGATFSIDPQEYFGLVGESGSGKSTIAKALIGGLDENGEVISGTIKYRGEEIQDFSEERLNEEIRWNEISMIPQSSMNSLDPTLRISKQAAEIAKVNADWGKERTIERLRELFDVVGLPPSRVTDYPHQFSGGMKQRAVIALSLLLEPSLIIADEPTTALDVIMQDRFLTYLEKIQEVEDVSLLLITHDISIVFESCDKMGVMHGGQIAEIGSVETVFDTPRHPYSILLQEAFPDIRNPDKQLSIIEGDPPVLREDVTYCTFKDRCPWAEAECRESSPPLEAMADDEDHLTSCFRADEMDHLASDFLAPTGENAAETENAETTRTD